MGTNAHGCSHRMVNHLKPVEADKRCQGCEVVLHLAHGINTISTTAIRYEHRICAWGLRCVTTLHPLPQQAARPQVPAHEIHPSPDHHLELKISIGDSFKSQNII